MKIPIPGSEIIENLKKDKETKPPRELGKTGRKFWKRVQKDYRLDKFREHQLELLNQACRCLDEITEGEKAVKKDGAYTEIRGEIKPHPGIVMVIKLTDLFRKLLREIGLPFNQEESRIPR